MITMGKEYTFRNKKFEVSDDRNLIFSLMKVDSIEELEGLSEIRDLNSLDLANNNITEIKKLEKNK